MYGNTEQSQTHWGVTGDGSDSSGFTDITPLQEAGVQQMLNTDSFMTSPPNWCPGAIFEEITPFH